MAPGEKFISSVWFDSTTPTIKIIYNVFTISWKCKYHPDIDELATDKARKKQLA